MKTARRFNQAWFMFAVVAAIVVGEVIAWQVANRFDLRANPVVVAFLSVGIVAAITSILYEGCDIG